LIRCVTLAGTACFVGAIVATSADHDVLAILLFLISLVIAVVLLIRRLFHAARDAVNDARAFASGDVSPSRSSSPGATGSRSASRCR
jgi:hypothetical protein